MSRSRLSKIILHLEYLLFLLRREIETKWPKGKRRTPNKRKRGDR